MGKYFGREPRYSREEIERQAQEAIDARVSLGRPPAEEWEPLVARMAEIDQAVAARPPVPAIPEPQPIQLRRVKVSPVTGPAKPAPAPRARRPVAARQGAD
jgi:hypothetical protein